MSAKLKWIPASAAIATAAAAVLAATPIAFADDVDQQSEAYQASMTQSDVKRDAAAIQAQLIELRDQMRQLMPDNVALVDQAIGKMQNLSKDQMDTAISALQDASRSKDAKEQLTKMATAFKEQATVSTALRKLSVDLQARETMASLVSEISSLIRREVGASQEIRRLGAIQQMPKDLHGNHEERWQISNEDQKGVTADLKLLTRKIDTLAADMKDEPENGIAQAGTVAVTEKLAETGDQAESATTNGPFNDAVTAQAQVIKTLVAMQQALANGKDPLDRLRALAERLHRASNDQKSVVDAVMLIGDRQDLERDFKTMQSNLGDETVAIRYELEPLNNQAAGQLMPAENAIDKTLKNFNRMWEEHMDARINTQESLKNINLTLAMIEQMVAQAEASAPQTPAQLLAALDQLQREVAQAAMQQAAVAKQPQVQPQQQAAMEARVESLQQRALPVSPEAAGLLGEAANQLPTATAAAQTSAAQSLAAAAQALAQQRQEVAALAAAQAQLAAADQALENADLAAAQQDSANAAQAAEAAAATEAAEAAADAAAQAGQGNAEAAAASVAAAQAALGQAMAQTPGMGGMAQAGTQVSEMMENQGPSNPDSKGNGGGGKAGDNLAGAGADTGPVQVLDGLQAKDRDAIAQLQSEKPPREFVPEVQQYYKNIADGAGL
ncbi:MAG: hypothetical protein ACREKL_03185 [Chthoniobacterales bacterium]